jgi:hypothetical protein
MYALYQQLESSARNGQRDRFQESEQHWLAQQSASQQQNGFGVSHLVVGLKTMFGKKVDNHVCLGDTCYCHSA